jgi:hypothetical protein
MERGLLWLPLLAVFAGLTWAGWNEYQKVASYQRWAQQFERSKYDIYAVLGQTATALTWGIPTRRGPVNLQTIPFTFIQQVGLTVRGQSLSLEDTGTVTDVPKGRVEIVLNLQNGQTALIPFTDLEIARAWLQVLSVRLGSPSA